MDVKRKLKDFLLPDITKQDFIQKFQELWSGNPERIGRLFDELDLDGDGSLSLAEVEGATARWLHPLTEPRTALIVVDFQNDFISGSLSVKAGPAGQDPEEAIPILNNLLQTHGSDCAAVIYTYDWHPGDHISFHDNISQRPLSPQFRGTQPALFKTVSFEAPAVEQTLWPRHCVQDSWGSQLHPDILVCPDSVRVNKGYHSDADSYSAFFDNNKAYATELEHVLREKGITHVLVCGLAYDVCVAATAADALSLGFFTAIIEDCTKGLDEGVIEEEKKKLDQKGCVFVRASDVPSLLGARNVPLNWALFSSTRTRNGLKNCEET